MTHVTQRFLPTIERSTQSARRIASSCCAAAALLLSSELPAHALPLRDVPPSASQPTAPAEQAKASQAPADRELAAYRVELLELAFGAASAFPTNPHVKNRARAQDEVVQALLELGQAERAQHCIARMDTWRRGALQADYAFHCAQRGAAPEFVVQQLALAESAAEEVREGGGQDWQRDRILSKIARAHAALGRAGEARRYEQGLTASETGRVAAVEAGFATADDFDARVAALDAIVAQGNFDSTRHALAAFAALHARFYASAERRALLEARIESSWSKTPLQVRVELLRELAEAALEHKDAPHALELIERAQALLEGTPWTPDASAIQRAHLSALRFRAGDAEGARQQAQRALADYSAGREQILSTERGAVLRALAEAHFAMGERAQALELYGRALSEGIANPNSRPRADELVAICCSLALAGCEPDEALWARLRQVRFGLGDPW
jgi:hypothetical protein